MLALLPAAGAFAVAEFPMASSDQKRYRGSAVPAFKSHML